MLQKMLRKHFSTWLEGPYSQNFLRKFCKHFLALKLISQIKNRRFIVFTVGNIKF